jgi:hypothetical protein
VLPTTEIWHRGRLRGVDCPTSDPVSFGLTRGAAHASFANLPGWSAQDSARRALAEHRAWLSHARERDGGELPYWIRASMPPRLIELSGLLGAARAALFADSLEAGAPELPVTAAAIVRWMCEHGPAARAAAEAAYEALRACRPQLLSPDAKTIGALRCAVRALPPYAGQVSPAASVR